MHPSIHPSIRVILCMCVCSSMHTSIQICLCVYSDTHAKKNRSYEGAKRVLTPKEGSVSRMSETSAIMSAGSVRVWMRAHSYGNMWLCLYVCTCVWIWICVLDTDIRTHTQIFCKHGRGAGMESDGRCEAEAAGKCRGVCVGCACFICMCVCARARACVCACVRVVLVYGYKWILPCVCAVCGGHVAFVVLHHSLLPLP